MTRAHVETDQCHECADTYPMADLLSSRVRGELLCWTCACQTRRGINPEHARLLVAARGALAALSQPATFPADVDAARKWLSDAIK